MSIPIKAQLLLRELDMEYGEKWDLIPETDERLLEVRQMLDPPTTTKGNRRIVWTEEMDNYLTENNDKTLIELSSLMDISTSSISRRIKHLRMKNASQTETNGGIIYTDADGNEHTYASVTLARIATRLPRKTIYNALKIGKEWRYA